MTMVEVTLSPALKNWLLATADDQLILAHRDSEWTGHAPILEEDVAIANISQDELGHANLWYGLLTNLEDQAEDYPDRLVYRRGPSEWRNAQLLELPKGDWAFTMLRQYFMDAYEHVLLGHLSRSFYQGIADIALKIHREELYHLKHTSAWVKRLGLGTPESHRRLQAALDQQWPLVGQLFQSQPDDAPLMEAGFIPDITVVEREWYDLVLLMLSQTQLSLPQSTNCIPSRVEHTSYLSELLEDLQKVARLDFQAEW